MLGGPIKLVASFTVGHKHKRSDTQITRKVNYIKQKVMHVVALLIYAFSPFNTNFLRDNLHKLLTTRN